MADTSVLEDRGAQGFVRELGLLDSVMLVTGSMIGSGIFIVSANIARQLGSAGGLLSPGYAVSLSVQQLVAVLLIVALSLVNTFGLRTGKLIQNVLTAVKTLALAGLIGLGLLVGRKAVALAANFSSFSAMWTPRDTVT